MNKESLILCVTPLQMVIAEKIIENNCDESFDIIVASEEDNPKFIYYYKKTINKTGLNLFFKTDCSSRVKLFFNLLKFKKKYKSIFGNKKYHKCYLASIDSKYFQFILSLQKKSEIFTFDDGTVNIIDNGLYTLGYKSNFFVRVVLYFLGVKIQKIDIIKKSSLHYTIYKGCKNIIDNTSFIELLNYSASEPIKKTKKIKIFIGQPMYEIDAQYDKAKIEKYIKLLDVNFYYKHPREKWELNLDDIYYIDDVLIIEDYILKYIKNNPDTEIFVYSFISSAMLNMASIKGLHLNFIVDSYLLERYYNFYTMAKEKFAIEYVSVE